MVCEKCWGDAEESRPVSQATENAAAAGNSYTVTEADREAMRRYGETHLTISITLHVGELPALRRLVAGTPVPLHDLATAVDLLREALEEFDNAERLRAEDAAAGIARPKGGSS